MSESELCNNKHKGRTKTSDLWNYFTYVDQNFASCNTCGKKLSHTSSSSNLRKHIKRKHGYSNLGSQEVSFVNFNGSFIDEDQGQEPVLPVIKKPCISKPTNSNSDLNITFPVTYKQVNKSQPSVTVNKCKTQQNSDMIHEAISILSNLAQSNHDETEDDEFGQFGKYITTQLRLLPLVTALEIQEKFYSILTKERIRVMKNATELHSYVAKPPQIVQNNKMQEHEEHETICIESEPVLEHNVEYAEVATDVNEV